MVQEYTPTKAEDRQSNNIGVSDFLKKLSIPWLIIIGGSVGGYFLGKVRMNGKKLPYFDGEVPFLNAAESLNGSGIKSSRAAEFIESMKAPSEGWQHFNNILKGFVPAQLYVAFTGWQEKEGTQIGLYEIAEDIEKVDQWHQTNEDLALDNKVTKMQIDHLREKRGAAPLFRVDMGKLEGRLEAAASKAIGD